MKTYTCLILLCILLLGLTACRKRNFFPDDDDPGLSRFTAHGFDVATNYINGKPYINPFSSRSGSSSLFLNKIVTTGILDTLDLSWQIEPNDSGLISGSPYRSISLLMSIPKSFNQQDLLSLSGQRFSSSTNTLLLNAYFANPLDTLIGTANIYFVKISNEGSTSTFKNFRISALFDGNIGDSIAITKGRFDFDVPAGNLNF
jgi:hypothetical protein